MNDNDSKYWKAGIFYYNKTNKKLLVPKRIGIGWTLNFAHPLAYIFLAIILALIIMPLIFH